MNRILRVLLVSLVVVFHGTSLWAQAPTAPVEFPPLDPAVCVQKAQHILIFDMKSGWWMGDGGNFHHQLLARIVKDCPTTIDIEYYYLQFLPEGVAVPGFTLSGPVGFLSYYPERPGVTNDNLMDANAFPSQPWSYYTQVWVLSGGNHDPSDIPTTSDFFINKILAPFAQATPPGQPLPGLFIGAGLNHHDHANRLLVTLQMPELFQSHSIDLITPSAGSGEISVLSRVRMGFELTPHPLFEGVASIADRIHVGGMDVDSDFLATSNIPFQVIGQDTTGEPAIGVRETETRRFVIDANMARFYSLSLASETNTYRYLHNLIKFLAKTTTP